MTACLMLRSISYSVGFWTTPQIFVIPFVSMAQACYCGSSGGVQYALSVAEMEVVALCRYDSERIVMQ